MENNIKSPFRVKNLVFLLISAGVITCAFLFLELIPKAKADLDEISNELPLSNLALLQGNSLVAISDPQNPESEVVGTMKVVITAYSSTPWETDDTPFITAAGTQVRDGIIANNYLPFGTQIRIPELYGDKIFVVEDRMSWKKGNYQIDIWFPSHQEAKEFGAKRTYIEILES